MVLLFAAFDCATKAYFGNALQSGRLSLHLIRINHKYFRESVTSQLIISVLLNSKLPPNGKETEKHQPCRFQ